MGIHDGHRDRLRTRFIENGLDNFNELNALELLLFYAIARKDTNELAHALLDQFGSLDGVFSATHAELCAVPGIGSNTAALLELIPQIIRKSEDAKSVKQPVLSNAAETIKYFKPKFLFEKDEKFIVACLDSQLRVINCKVLAQGVVTSVLIDTRMVVEHALKSRATCLALAHNHPDGPSIPSVEDDATTKRLMEALSLVDIEIYDHVIIGREDNFSYRKTGKLDIVKRMMSF